MLNTGNELKSKIAGVEIAINNSKGLKIIDSISGKFWSIHPNENPGKSLSFLENECLKHRWTKEIKI